MCGGWGWGVRSSVEGSARAWPGNRGVVGPHWVPWAWVVWGWREALTWVREHLAAPLRAGLGHFGHPFGSTGDSLRWPGEFAKLMAMPGGERLYADLSYASEILKVSNNQRPVTRLASLLHDYPGAMRARGWGWTGRTVWRPRTRDPLEFADNAVRGSRHCGNSPGRQQSISVAGSVLSDSVWVSTQGK
jgi:hypothetical protein